MADAIATQQSIDPDEMLLMRIKGMAAQIRRHEAKYMQYEDADEEVEDLHTRIKELKKRLGKKFQAEIDRVMSGLQTLTPEPEPYSPTS